MKRNLKQRKNNSKKRKMNIIRLSKPEPVLTTEYQNVKLDTSDNCYTVPIDRLALAQLIDMNGQHGGIVYARHNMIASDYVNGGLNHEQLKAAAFDYVLFGDVAILKVRDGFGRVVKLHPLPSLFLRIDKEENFRILQENEPLIYKPDDVIFIKQYDPQQQVYGKPDYIGGIHSALLNSEATLFRRRYYHNGAHTGGIIYTNDPHLSDEMEEEIISKLGQSKGIGNFSTLFVHIPDGDPEGIKFLPVGDIGAKDEFSNVKNISAQDVLNAHRFPAGLAGIIPSNAAGLGDPEKARGAYRESEVIPIQRLFAERVNSDLEIPAHLHLNFRFD